MWSRSVDFALFGALIGLGWWVDPWYVVGMTIGVFVACVCKKYG
jgi:uncharacterized membrane protein